MEVAGLPIDGSHFASVGRTHLPKHYVLDSCLHNFLFAVRNIEVNDNIRSEKLRVKVIKGSQAICIILLLVFLGNSFLEVVARLNVDEMERGGSHEPRPCIKMLRVY